MPHSILINTMNIFLRELQYENLNYQIGLQEQLARQSFKVNALLQPAIIGVNFIQQKAMA